MSTPSYPSAERFAWLLNPFVLRNRCWAFLRFLKAPFDTIFFHCVRVLFSFFPFSSLKTVLLFRLDGVGDFIFFARYLPLIRSAFPGFKVVMFCQSPVVPLARAVEGIDVVEEIPLPSLKWNYVHRVYFLRRIRKYRAQAAIHLTYHRRHLGDELTLMSGAKQTVAFSGNDETILPSIRKRNSRYFTSVIRTPDNIPEAKKYDVLFAHFGISNASELIRQIPLKLRKVKDGFSDLSRFVVVGPGSYSSLRRWPVERFAQLADHLAGTHSMNIVLCGNRAEENLLRTIAKAMKSKTEIIFHRSLPEVAELLKKSVLFVGNDSGLLHLAASLNVPSVGIVGGGHFNRYFPYGSVEVVTNHLPCFECNWNCIFREAHCVTGVSVGSVLAAVEKVMDREVRQIQPTVPSPSSAAR